jgi:hypothetical protein
MGTVLTCRRQGRASRAWQDLRRVRTWALGNRELDEVRTQSAAKPITDSNLRLRGPAQRPAVRYAADSASLRRSGVPEPGIRYALRRWSARCACLAVLVVPGFECFSGREHLEGQWGGGVGPSLAGPGVRPTPARVGAEEQTQEAASAELAVCDEFRSAARSALPGHRREGDSRWV